MSNGPPPPPPPNGDPEVWYDEYWDSDVWWSGTADCMTDVSVGGFDTGTAELLPPVLEWIRENTNHTPTISGGHENGEHECHTATCSRHYCGKAFDIYTLGWTSQEKQALYDWVMEGWPARCALKDTNHVHISGSSSGCTC